MLADIDMKKIWNVVRKTCIVRIKISLLEDVKIQKRFDKKNEVVVDAPNLWVHFKDGVLKACDKVCWKKMERSRGDTWWWNEEGGAISRKKDAHWVMCRNSTEENKKMYKTMKNKALKAVSRVVREKGEDVLTELNNYPNWMFILA